VQSRTVSPFTTIVTRIIVSSYLHDVTYYAGRQVCLLGYGGKQMPLVSFTFVFITV